MNYKNIPVKPITEWDGVTCDACLINNQTGEVTCGTVRRVKTRVNRALADPEQDPTKLELYYGNAI